MHKSIEYLGVACIVDSGDVGCNGEGCWGEAWAGAGDLVITWAVAGTTIMRILTATQYKGVLLSMFDEPPYWGALSLPRPSINVDSLCTRRMGPH
jgi:hypothetical protein